MALTLGGHCRIQIVISRFVYSYEQAFKRRLDQDVVRRPFSFASAYALISEGHVRVDVFYTKFTKKRKAVSNSIGSMILGIPLCLVILGTGMWGKGSSLNSPLLSFEVYQQGFWHVCQIHHGRVFNCFCTINVGSIYRLLSKQRCHYP